MKRQNRIRAMLFMLVLIFLGVFLMRWIELQVTGLLLIMFSAGFALRETLEPMPEVKAE